MISDKISPLVITPKPFKNESLHGFILRTSEMNGYGTPSHMLRYSGMTENEIRSARMPLEKLILLYGYDAYELKPLMHIDNETTLNMKTLLLNGHRIPTSHLQIKNSKICPDCIQENGYADNYWQLRYAQVCPKHLKKLVLTCDLCGKHLSWMRPGLLQCKCNSTHIITNMQNDVIHDEFLIFLQSVLQSKVHNKSLVLLNNDDFKFPFDDLDNTPLNSLLGIIERIGRISVSLNKSGLNQDNKEITALKAAAQFFANWPNGVYKILDDIYAKKNNHDDIFDFGLTRALKPFYDSLFRSGLPDKDTNFIREIFTKYGAHCISKSSNSNTSDKTINSIVGISKLSHILNVHKSTIHKMVSVGLIQPIPSKSGRLLFDTTQNMPNRIEEGVSFTAREAASYIGLPVSVLDQLREDNVYTVTHIGNKVQSYHEYDLRIFKDRLVNKADFIKQNSPHNPFEISIAEIMRMKLNSHKIKADIITSILNDKLHVIYKKDNSVQEMYLDVEPVTDYICKNSVKYFKSLTVRQAVPELNCDYYAVKQLVSEGYIESDSSSENLKILTKSIQAFNSKYIFCNAIAIKVRRSTRSIQNECQKLGIKVHLIETQSGKKHGFIDKEFLHVFLP